jgi:glycosyltransferase involved in cell wall biosynthesis
MKVAVVHSYYSGDTPSGENAVVDMQVAALREAGHTVRLLSVRTDELRNRRFYTLESAANVALGLGYDPLPELLAYKPDVVHVHNLFPNIGTAWLRAWQGPIVATMHNFRPMCAAGNLFRDGETCTLCPSQGQHHGLLHRCYKGSAVATLPLAIRNRGGLAHDDVLRRADRVIFLSGRAKSTYMGFGFPAGRATILPNFVETASGTYDAPNKRSWVYAGRLSADKGIVDLVDVWPESEVLEVFGDGPEMAKLRSKASPSVNIRGSVPRDEVLKAVRSAQGVVIPSLWAEGLPTIYLEALAAGVPVLAKSGNSAADDIETSRCGIVFAEFSRLNLAVEALSDNRQQFSGAAAARFVDMFTRQAWVRRIEALYDSLLPTA